MLDLMSISYYAITMTMHVIDLLHFCPKIFVQTPSLETN